MIARSGACIVGRVTYYLESELVCRQFDLIIFFECAVWEVGHHHFAGISNQLPL